MRTLVCGSRDIKDGPFIFHALDALNPWPTCILSGMARGPDKIAAAWAKHRGVPLEPYPADWARYGTYAGFRRNLEMLEKAERVVAFWDGKSKGTEHTVKHARLLGLPVLLYQPLSDAQLVVYSGRKGGPG